MEQVCSRCGCVITKENQSIYHEYYNGGVLTVVESICKNCREIKPRNRHEKRKQKALRRRR